MSAGSSRISATADDSVIDLIEEDLDCAVALRVAAVLGSSPTAQKKLAKTLVKYNGPFGEQQARSAPDFVPDFISVGFLKKNRVALRKKFANVEKQSIGPASSCRCGASGMRSPRRISAKCTSF